MRQFDEFIHIHVPIALGIPILFMALALPLIAWDSSPSPANDASFVSGCAEPDDAI